MNRYGYQDVNRPDIFVVIGFLKSVKLTQDLAIAQLEQSVAANTGAQQDVAIKSLDLDLDLGEWLWTTPNTYLFEPKLIFAAMGVRLQRLVAPPTSGRGSQRVCQSTFTERGATTS